ncbi:unnamed protein product [Blepharisma stoltei]|uniref:Uncharacterized protein n=1 Tax=Blepharisma stoltei TaxID=1481888 RepID=A0AAU9JQ14_9CILI|nr:unnamed protein product [Blepharisma stoltei]
MSSLVFMNELFRKKVKDLYKKDPKNYQSSRSPKRNFHSQIDFSKLEIERRAKSPINISNKSQLFIAELLRKQESNRITRHSSRPLSLLKRKKANEMFFPGFSPHSLVRYSKTPSSINRQNSCRDVAVEAKLPIIIKNCSKKDEEITREINNAQKVPKLKKWRLHTQQTERISKEAGSAKQPKQKDAKPEDWVISAW